MLTAKAISERIEEVVGHLSVSDLGVIARQHDLVLLVALLVMRLHALTHLLEQVGLRRRSGKSGSSLR